MEADFFNDAKKSCDNFSALKSNNYLGYAMAAFHAKNNKLDDCLMFNSYGRLSDSTIANVFIITNGIIKTPAITEGCVDGVMRKYLISCFKKESMPCFEGEVLVDDVLQASEVFLTNAIFGMRWVKKVRTSNYSNELTSFLHKKFIAPLFSSSTI